MKVSKRFDISACKGKSLIQRLSHYTPPEKLQLVLSSIRHDIPLLLLVGLSALILITASFSDDWESAGTTLFFACITSLFFLTVLLLRRHLLLTLTFSLLLSGFFIHLKPYVIPASGSLYSVMEKLNAEGVKITVDGMIVSIFHQENRERVILQLYAIHLPEGEEYQVSGKVKLSIYPPLPEQTLRLNDIIRIQKIKLKEIRNFNNPGTFNYALNQRIKGIRFSGGVSGKRVQMLRHGSEKAQYLEKVRTKVRELLSEQKEAAILTALLLGDTSQLDEATREDFSESGIAHLFAVSGLHIGFIAGVFFFLFRLLSALSLYFIAPKWFYNGMSERLAALCTIIPTVAYTTLVGDKSSAIRACTMIVVYLIFAAMGLWRSVLKSVHCAAILLLIHNPLLLFDIGFQLSFTAVYAIVLGFSLWRIPDERKKCEKAPELPASDDLRKPIPMVPLPKSILLRFFLLLFTTSLFASAATAPLLIYSFHIFSPLSVLFNCLAVPMAAVIVPVAFFGMLAGFINSTLSSSLFNLASHLINLLKKAAESFSHIPASHAYLPSPSPAEVTALCCGAFLLILLTPFLLQGIQKKRGLSYCGGLSLLLISLFLSPLLLNTPQTPSSVRISLIDVGQGESILIETENKTVLTDAGNRIRRRNGNAKELKTIFDAGKLAVTPYVRQRNIKHIDTLIATHFHSDHAGGMGYILSHFSVGELLIPPPFGSHAAEELIAVAKEKGVPVRIVGKGEKILLSPRTTIRILSPDKKEIEAIEKLPAGKERRGWEENNRTLVMELQENGKRMLLTSDLEKEGEKRLLKTYRNSIDILKVGHHASASSTTENLLETLKPRYALISLGYLNRFHFPHPSVIKRLKKHHIEIHRTDREGCIALILNPEIKIGSCGDL